MHRKIYTFLFSILIGCLFLPAQEVEVDNIRYYIYENEATVLGPQGGDVSKTILIPDSIALSKDSDATKYPVIRIGNGAFSGQSQLDSIILPASMREIGNNAFARCDNLHYVMLPDSLTQIAMGAFRDCITLQNVILPDALTEIGHTAFRNCTNLTAISIPNKITIIEPETFGECTSLTSVTLGENVKEIRDGAFFRDPIDNIICLGSLPPTVGYYAFSDNYLDWCRTCKVTVPEDAKMAYRENNFWMNFFNYLEIDGFHYILNFKELTANLVSIDNELRSTLEVLEVPESITFEDNAYKITSVSGFERCEKLTTVKLPDSILSVEGFYYCDNLKDINLPQSLTNIGRMAFYGCSSLSSINLPASLTYIGNESFFLCTSLKEITCEAENPIGDASNFFGSPIFADANLILKSNEEEYRHSPGWSRFFNCVSHDGIYYLLDYEKKTAKTTFEYPGGDINYSGLTTMVIPSEIEKDGQKFTVNVIGEGFLSNVMYASPASSMGYSQKDMMRNSIKTRSDDDNVVTDVELPSSIVEIATGAFSYCYLKNIKMKEGIQYIGEEAFADSEIEEIVLPNSVKGIGKEAFTYCSQLKDVTLGTELKLIDDRAFYSYNGIENVKCLALTPPSVGEEVFSYDTYRNATLFVPEESIYDYKAADGWKSFSNMKEFAGVVEIKDSELISSDSIVDVLDLSGKIVAHRVRMHEISTIVPSGIYILKLENQHYLKYYIK